MNTNEEIEFTQKHFNISVNADFTHLEPDEIERMKKDFGIEAVLLNAWGPGGGNPEFVLMGQPHKILEYFVSTEYFPNREEALDVYPELNPGDTYVRHTYKAAVQAGKAKE